MSAEANITAPLERLTEEVSHLMSHLDPLAISDTSGHASKLGIFDFHISTYTVFFVFSAALLMILLLVARKKMALVPKGRIMNAFEFLVDFARNNIAGVIQHDRDKYVPFLLTIFFFILLNNFMGLIPGFKPGTGTIAGTLALAIIVFVYFLAMGVRQKGLGKAIKEVVPHGLPKPIVPIIFVLEIVSIILRPITQALRLFANMYAGHIVLGIFSLLTSLFFEAAVFGHAWANLAASPIWLVLLIALLVLELVVAFVQAYVFSLLTAVYINSSVSSH